MRSLDEWRDARRLTAQRAGKMSQRFAAERLDRFVRSRLKMLSIAVAFVLIVSLGMWALLSSRPGLQGLAVGILAGVSLTFLYHWCVVASGAAQATMGSAAEQWTDAELRRLRRKGWRHINHVVIKPELGDIDHVAVGPDGVIVVETKWRSAEVDVDNLSHSMRSAVAQAKRNRDQVRQLLNWQRREPLLVQPLVVLWGPEVAHASAEPVLSDDVNVISGRALREELAHLSDERLSADEIEDVYAQLKKRVADRDGWEAKNSEPRPLTLQAQADLWGRNAVAFMSGFALAALTFPLGSWSIAIIVGLALAGLGCRRVGAVRAQSAWFIGGVLVPFPIVLLLALWSSLT